MRTVLGAGVSSVRSVPPFHPISAKTRVYFKFEASLKCCPMDETDEWPDFPLHSDPAGMFGIERFDAASHPQAQEATAAAAYRVPPPGNMPDFQARGVPAPDNLPDLQTLLEATRAQLAKALQEASEVQVWSDSGDEVSLMDPTHPGDMLDCTKKRTALNALPCGVCAGGRRRRAPRAATRRGAR